MNTNATRTFWKPSNEQIEAIKVGDSLPNCFGVLAVVKSIFAQGRNIHGRPYVCCYLAFGDNATISHSFVAGELVHTVALNHLHTSAQLDKIEREMNDGEQRGDWVV